MLITWIQIITHTNFKQLCTCVRIWNVRCFSFTRRWGLRLWSLVLKLHVLW